MIRSVAMYRDCIFPLGLSCFSNTNKFTNNPIHYVQLFYTIYCNYIRLVAKLERNRSVGRYRDSMSIVVSSWCFCSLTNSSSQLLPYFDCTRGYVGSPLLPTYTRRRIHYQQIPPNVDAKPSRRTKITSRRI